ncbi:MAG: carbohydrate kinase [Pseudomonadota bacterium]
MILCAGEALIDMLPRETAAGEAAFAPHAGGAVFNTAIALGRLGAPVQFYSGISSDFFGEVLVDALVASKVDASPAHRSDAPSTLAFVKLVDGQATYLFYDENTAGRMLTEAQLPDVTADAYFFGGISLAVEPCASTYAAFQAKVVAAEKVTMIDPNVRPGFIKDADVYRSRITTMISASDIVKLSDEDLEWFMPEGDTLSNAQHILNQGVKLLCITEGSKGITAYTATRRLFVPAEKAEVVDTVGAGDTFNAGVLASLHAAGALTKDAVATLSDDTIKEALTLGAKAAAMTVSRAGANPPWAKEL